MTQDYQSNNANEKTSSGVLRYVPPLILISVLGGFISLAIYAYKAGGQNVAEGELMVIEADKTPMKEAPADPGGMQFPNQDKTIFETFAANGTSQPKVERVLPTPEEPIAKDSATAETTTWINDKLSPAAQGAPAAAEQVIGAEPVAAAPVAVAPAQVVEDAPAKVVDVREELGKQAVSAPVELKKTEAPTAVKEVTVQPAPIKAPFKPEVVKETAAPKTVAKPAAVDAKSNPSTSGKQLVQLGAYKSEAEARADFAKIQKKHAALAGASPVVNRADLGDKGVFYRLRVATADAKALCAKLAGQACMVVK